MGLPQGMSAPVRLEPLSVFRGIRRFAFQYSHPQKFPIFSEKVFDKWSKSLYNM